jgi:hypothetical protein
MNEWATTENQPVKRLVVKTLDDGSDISYTVGGQSGVTRIEQCEKSGMYSNLPYLRVYIGDEVIAELCQHNIESVHFK